jgi:hypothetical protein
LLLTSCATREGASHPSDRQAIELPPVSLEELTATTVAVMERRGFLAAPAFTAGSSVVRRPGGSLLRFVKGGQPEVWFVAEPTAGGWQLLALPQPDPLFRGATPRRFDGALHEIASKLSLPPAS